MECLQQIQNTIFTPNEHKSIAEDKTKKTFMVKHYVENWWDCLFSYFIQKICKKTAF
jgi:hypothetical protein